MSNFDLAFEYTLGDEGGYTDDPNDSGGPTNWGITISDLSNWMGRQATVDEVKEMTQDTAKAIYQARYWAPLNLDLLSESGKTTAIFDIGVVCGIGVGARLAQEACNSLGSSLRVDGQIGTLSIAAIGSAPIAKFIQAFSGLTLARFRAIAQANPKDQVFLHGWTNRANRLLTLVT